MKTSGGNGIWIGRPSKWGNPFRLQDHTRKDAITRYEQYLLQSHLMDDLYELEGQFLICGCYPLPCHGDVLIKYIYKDKTQHSG